jgi:hypothetical protein
MTNNKLILFILTIISISLLVIMIIKILVFVSYLIMINFIKYPIITILLYIFIRLYLKSIKTNDKISKL